MPTRRKPPLPPAVATASEYVEQLERSPSLVALRELITVLEQVPGALARRANLSATELSALQLLIRASHSPGDLARGLGVTTAASSGIIDRLVARGFAQRQPHQSDRRRMHVLITEGGREHLMGHLLPMYAALQELDAQLNAAQREQIAKYLQGASGAMQRLL